MPIPQTAGQTFLPQNGQGVGPEDYLPPGTTLLDTLQADLDNDGASETVLAFNSEDHAYEPGNGGAVVVDDPTDHQPKTTWDMRPPSGGRLREIAIRDINVDGVLEVLLYKSTEDQTRHYLHIFAWNGASYAYLSTNGEEAVISAYYPPEVRNVDSGEAEELLLFVEVGSSERLRTIVYHWDGESYARADWITILGPLRRAGG